jgi:DNA-binding CsgD family transcriptional regulator
VVSQSLRNEIPFPLPRAPLVGREHDVRAVRALLTESNVPPVTLAGPGGGGKTRLSLEIAATVTGAYTDGITFVPLATVTDPAQVLPAIAAWLPPALALIRRSAPRPGRPVAPARPTTPAPPDCSALGLSRRESEVLRLLSERLGDKEIAEELSISPRTVMAHVASIFNKPAVNDRRAAAAFARRHGLV